MTTLLTWLYGFNGTESQKAIIVTTVCHIGLTGMIQVAREMSKQSNGTHTETKGIHINGKEQMNQFVQCNICETSSSHPF
jgi:hypothetical protein